MRRAPVQGKIPASEGAYMEGVTVGPKEREPRLANQRVDRSHRRGGSLRRRPRPPPWTRVEKGVLVLSFALIVGTVILAVVLFLLP